MRHLSSLVFVCLCAFAAFGAAVRASDSTLPTASYAKVGGPTLMPYGWYDFCTRRPEECDVARLSPSAVKLSQRTWSALNQVNSYVNGIIIPESNFDHWGTMLDHWDYPTDGKGDCKVYALYKRKILMDNGFPRQALLMTIVFDLHGEAHAILTVVTDRGEFVLDNLTNEIKPWNATGYKYVKRQSQDDPNVWLDLGGQRGPGVAMASAG
jgi:predicted transglutaminase-like cysteine proteinase